MSDEIDYKQLSQDLLKALTVICSQLPSKQMKPNTFLVCCPFHEEKTPSFFVDLNKEKYCCFGCGKEGWDDVVVDKVWFDDEELVIVQKKECKDAA